MFVTSIGVFSFFQSKNFDGREMLIQVVAAKFADILEVIFKQYGNHEFIGFEDVLGLKVPFLLHGSNCNVIEAEVKASTSLSIDPVKIRMRRESTLVLGQ